MLAGDAAGYRAQRCRAAGRCGKLSAHVAGKQAIVTAEQDGQTLAAIVRAIDASLPWSKAKKLVADGRVRVDDHVQRDPARRVAKGDRVVIDATGSRPSPPRDELSIAILHVDPQIVVVDKPAGISSVPFGDERDSLQHRVHQLLKRRLKTSQLPPLRVVQRLDKETSGVLVFARTKAAEKSLGSQLRAHTVDRRYVALCEGRPVAATHESWLVPDRGDGRRGSARVRAGASPPTGSRRAVTHVQPLQQFATDRGVVSLVRCTLSTGRQHQIRIHLAEAGHPLLGERVYGDRRRTPIVSASRVMLHAEHLGFMHPSREIVVAFDAALPPDFSALLQSLRATTR